MFVGWCIASLCPETGLRESEGEREREPRESLRGRDAVGAGTRVGRGCREAGGSGEAKGLRLGGTTLSNATCLLRPHLLYACFRRVKDRHSLLR